MDPKWNANNVTEAMNLLEEPAHTIKSTGLFKEKPIDDIDVKIVQEKSGLSLVPSKQRGATGDPVKGKNRQKVTLEVPHYPQDDTVLADDARGLIKNSTAQEKMKMADVVNDKLQTMKNKLAYTREHARLGACQGKIIDKDGSVIVDVYKKFGIEERIRSLKLGTANTNVDALLRKFKIEVLKERKGVVTNGFIALCGLEFLNALQYHDSIKELYEKFKQGADKYIDKNETTQISFYHDNINFIVELDEFGTNADLKTDEALLLPTGGDLFHEYLAPADINNFVDKKGKAYYASLAPRKHNRGVDIHTQTNALPLCVRPDLITRLKAN